MKTAIWIIVAIVLVGGIWWFFSMPPVNMVPTPTTGTDNTTTTSDQSTTTETATTTSPTSSADGSANSAANEAAPMTATVMYNAQGFSPATVTIAKGGTVTWVNQSGAGMWVASDQHPSHTGYAGTSRQQHCPDTSGTAFDQCAPGDKYSFTFSKTGTWGFHNHVNATANGTVIVK